MPQTQKEIDYKPKPGNFQVSFSLEDADLPELVKAISNVTGKRFIYGSKLKSIKATVYSPEKVSAAEAYAAFLSILDANGLTVIPQGQFLKIVESQNAAQLTTPVFGTASPVPAEDRYVTRLYRLSNVDAAEVSKALEKFKTKDGDISVYAPGNLLIVTDTGTNIRRMLRIVEEIDVGTAGDQIWVQPVVNGSAGEMAQKLNEILGVKSGGKGGANVISDDRTNSLVITATKGDYERILELFKRIDVPMSGDGQLHVVPLQHAQCSELSTTLNSILGSGSGSSGRTTTGGAGRPTPTGPSRTGATGAAGAGGTTAGGGTGQSDDIFEGKVKVTCDEATNSLVTTSSLRDYAQLREVIDKLDMPRRQVFIEAVIMDLDVEHSTDLGLSYHGGAPFTVGGKQSFLYGGNNVAESVTGVPSAIEGLALGVRGPDVEGTENIFGPGVSIPALGVVLHALGKDSDSNVLATPHVLATDNIQAEISIGQTIPLQNNLGLGLGSLASAAGGAAATAGIASLLGGGGLGGSQSNYKDVGTKIDVTPHVNDSDQVRLDIEEEISDLGARDGALGAATINKPHRQDHAHRSRSADGRHRRSHARPVHGRRDQDPDPRRHPGPRFLLQAAAEAEAQDQPAPHPHPLRGAQSGRPPGDLRAQDAGAPGVPRSLLRLRREHQLGAAPRLLAQERARRSDPPDDARRRRARADPRRREEEDDAHARPGRAGRGAHHLGAEGGCWRRHRASPSKPCQPTPEPTQGRNGPEDEAQRPDTSARGVA